MQRCKEETLTIEVSDIFSYPKLATKIIRNTPTPGSGSLWTERKPRNAILCATWALNSVCLSARQGLGNVSPAFRLLTLTDVRYWADRNGSTFREIERSFEGLSAEHLPASGIGGSTHRIIDYNTDNIYIYIYVYKERLSKSPIYSYVCCAQTLLGWN